MPVPFRKSPLAAAISAALLAVPASSFAITTTPSGDEFEVPQDSGNTDQELPDVAIDDDGNFIVVWAETGDDDIVAQRFDASGARLGSEFIVNTDGSAVNRFEPRVAMDADGDFVVSWFEFSSSGSFTYDDIVYRVFQADGSPVTADQDAAASVRRASNAGSGKSIDVAMDEDGDFVISWVGFDGNSYDDAPFVRSFNANGNPLNTVTLASTDPAGNNSSIDMADNGTFVVTWMNFAQAPDGDGNGIFARRFDVNGNPLDGNEFLVNTTTTNNQRWPDVAVQNNGDFVIAWHADSGNIDYQRFAADRSTVGGETQANVADPITAPFPQVGIADGGDFAISWDGADGGENGIFARAFAADGSPQSGDLAISQGPAPQQRDSELAVDADGDFVVVWDENYEDVFARRFVAPEQQTIGGTSGGPGSLGWLGALGLGLAALGRRLFGRRRKRGGGVAGLLAGALALGTMAGTPEVRAADDLRLAGEVESASGTVTASRDDESRRSLSGGDPVYVGDRVRTGADASALLRLADGTEVDLRADSEFRVAGIEGRIEEDGGGLSGMFMDLLRGGLRIITGSVADSDADNYRLRTPVATIGVRGTEFEARVCQRGQPCPGAEESDTEPREPAARLLKLRGVVEATGANGATRVIDAGDGVYEGDTVETVGNAWAVLQFADDSRVSLQPGTRFRVDEWEFESDDADDGNALLNLFRGGMRVLTGLIGDAASDNYRVSTPVATIGVRGTGFDLVCVGSCINAEAALGAVEGDGLFISTWDGTAFAELEGAVAEFAAGETGFIANRVLPAVRLQSLPPALQNLSAPRPDQVLGQLPDGTDRLYTQVEDGTISVQGATGDALAVGAGSAATVAAGGSAASIAPVSGGPGLGSATISAAFGALLAQQFDLVAPYAGASTGRSGVDSDDAFEDRIQQDFPSATVTSLSNSAIGTRAFGGVRVLEVLAFEVGYVDLGELNSQIDPGGADEAAVGEDAVDKHPIVASGLDFSTLVRTPVNINTWAFARAGVFVWEADISTTTPSGQTFTRSVDGTDAIVGGGVEHKIGPGLWARAEWIHYRLDPDQVNFVGGGLVWTFP